MTQIEAVAEVIRAAGFDAMARQYVEEPSLRPRIIPIIAGEIERKLGPKRAARFTALARTAG